MSQEICIDNFRSFKNLKIEQSRVTILIGENSSGKSSFIKFLLALKQTIEEPEISNLILNGSLVDLGNYKETIYYHDDSKSINFGFNLGNELYDYYRFFFSQEIKIKKNKEISSLLSTLEKNKTHVYFTLNKDLSNHKSVITEFSNESLGKLSLTITSIKDELDIAEVPTCKLIYERKKDSKTYTFENIGYEAKAFLSVIYSQDLQEDIKNRELDSIIFFELAAFLLTQNVLEFFLRNIIYINPLNTKPQRIYFNKDAQSTYKVNNLEKFANKVSNKTVSPSEIKEFSKILANYGIAENIQLLTSKEFPVSEIKVKINDLLSNIYDVGYGVSLQVPLIFEAFMSEKNYGNHFLIEQPEVHLHPKLQAKLIEVLVGLGDKNTYTIETHSEHIVRMLQILVKEHKYNLNSDNVKIYYFSRGGTSFNITEHKILENGQLDKKFPSGFYDNSYNLTKSLMF